jgi:hypothetical protein
MNLNPINYYNPIITLWSKSYIRPSTRDSYLHKDTFIYTILYDKAFLEKWGYDTATVYGHLFILIIYILVEWF